MGCSLIDFCQRGSAHDINFDPTSLNICINGVGAVYGSPDSVIRSKSRQIFAEVVAAEGLKVLGWRDVPTDHGSLGETARWRSRAAR